MFDCDPIHVSEFIRSNALKDRGFILSTTFDCHFGCLHLFEIQFLEDRFGEILGIEDLNSFVMMGCQEGTANGCIFALNGEELEHIFCTFVEQDSLRRED